MDAAIVKVLVIDDDPDALETLRAVVKDAIPACVFLCAENGPSGITLARAEEPDLVLLGRGKRGLNGLEICRTIKDDARLQAIPALLLTAYPPSPADRFAVLMAGSEGFLALPIDPIELTIAVRVMVKVKAAGRFPRLELSEKTLREREAFSRAVLDNLPMGVAVNSVDPSVSFSYINDAFTKAYRTTREALSHPNAFWSAVYEEDAFREAMRHRILDDCASGDSARMHWEDVPITRHGEETTFVSASNIPIPGLPLVISTVWDVTERKRAELRLKEAEERTRTLFDATPEALFVIDPAGLFLEVNHAAAARYGYAREELLQMRVSDLSVPALRGQVPARLNDARVSETDFQWRHQRKDATELAVEILTRPIAWKGRACILASVRDISERKQAEARIVGQLEELRRWHDATLGREGRILELKNEINQLLTRAGQPPRYPSALADDSIHGLKDTP